MTWVQRILQRNIVAYIVLAAVLTLGVDHAKVSDQRGRYLLGIFYNGHFKDYKDGVVYFDYLLRQNPNDLKNYGNLSICYKELGDMRQAEKYRMGGAGRGVK